MRVNATTSVGRVEVVADQDGLTSRAGTALLAGVADRVGLTGALGEAMGDVRLRASRHCPGRALRDVAVMLADGGDALCDLRVLRDEPSLFGAVASDATAWRAVAAVDADRLDEVSRVNILETPDSWQFAARQRSYGSLAVKRPGFGGGSVIWRWSVGVGPSEGSCSW